AAIADVGKRAMHRQPVDVAVADVPPGEAAVRTIELEVFQMDLDDAPGERANPILRVAVEDDVADVEVGLQPWRIEFVDVARELERTEEELVPDFLDGDDHLQLLRAWQQSTADHVLRSRPRVAVRRGRID